MALSFEEQWPDAQTADVDSVFQARGQKALLHLSWWGNCFTKFIGNTHSVGLSVEGLYVKSRLAYTVYNHFKCQLYVLKMADLQSSCFQCKHTVHVDDKWVHFCSNSSWVSSVCLVCNLWCWVMVMFIFLCLGDIYWRSHCSKLKDFQRTVDKLKTNNTSKTCSIHLSLTLKLIRVNYGWVSGSRWTLWIVLSTSLSGDSWTSISIQSERLRCPLWGAASGIFKSSPGVNMGPHTINTPLTSGSIAVKQQYFVYLCVL